MGIHKNKRLLVIIGKKQQMLLLFLFWKFTFVFQCVTTRVSDPGIIEIDKSGSILHYSPVSSGSHWLLQPSDEGIEYLVGPRDCHISHRCQRFIVHYIYRASGFV